MRNPQSPTAAVIGTGAVGQDLISKICRSEILTCALVAGRNPDSAGLRHAERLGCPTSAAGIEAVLAADRPYDVVFDATSAAAHREHWKLLAPLGSLVVDLTPSKVGTMVVPTVTAMPGPGSRNVNLVSCGGQASVPIVSALAARYPMPYAEVVSTVASVVAGRATRMNLDEYVSTTGRALTVFSGVPRVKAILNISPAVPPAMFRTTVHAIAPGADLETVREVAGKAAEQVREMVPGYRVVACDVRGDRVTIAVHVVADSEVLPPYAGNLDIINAAAVLVAERCAVTG